MLRQVRLYWFQLKQYLAVSYFIQLLILSTTLPLIIQFIAAQPDELTSSEAWIRAGVIGMWTNSLTAAGILGFERMRGTLPYLTHAVIHPVRAISASITPTSVSGIFAFPLAYIEWIVLCVLTGHSLPISFQLGTPVSVAVLCILGIFCLWMACWVISMTIGWLFLITPHALAYEGLLSVPILIASGIFALEPAEGIVRLTYLIPLRIPVEFLYFPQDISVQRIAIFLVVLVCWGAVSLGCARFALHRIRVTGTLEVM